MKVWITERHLIDRDGTVVNTWTGKTIKKIKGSSTGYELYPKYLMSSVHRAMAHCFLGGIPDGMVVNHIDGNKTHNDLSNLEIVTHAENTQHAYDTGLARGKKGEDNSQAKVSTEEILEMYDMFREGYNNLEVAETYGLHDRYVSLIRHKHRWKHLAPVNEVFPKSFNLVYSRESLLKAYDMLKAGCKNLDVARATGIEKSNISRMRNGKYLIEFFEFHRGCND